MPEGVVEDSFCQEESAAGCCMADSEEVGLCPIAFFAGGMKTIKATATSASPKRISHRYQGVFFEGMGATVCFASKERIQYTQNFVSESISALQYGHFFIAHSAPRYPYRNHTINC